MKYVALLSGGKDSCFNLLHCQKNGHELVAAASLGPGPGKDELDSFMYQTVGQDAIEYVAKALNVPLYRKVIAGSVVEQGLEYGGRLQSSLPGISGDETEDLFDLLSTVKSQHPDIGGVSVGAILSNYQRVRVEHVCRRLSLTPLCYLWQRNQTELLFEMIDAGLEAVLIKVAGIGLKPIHLGRSLSQMQHILLKLNEQYGSHVCGEGGEYETLTLDSPMFKYRIDLAETETVIHSDNDFATVAFLRIKRASLEPKDTPLDLRISLPALLEDDFASVVSTIILAPHQNSIPVALQAVQNAPGESHPPIASRRKGSWICIGGIQRTMADSSSLPSLGLEVRECFETLGARLQAQDLTFANCSHINILLSSMDLFSAVNAVYGQFFGVSPPSRACVAVDLPPGIRVRLECLAFHESAPGERQALHVQGLSYWAPANIGPYSQAVKVRERIFVSGQIGLIPSNLAMPSPKSLVFETALACQHVKRVVSALRGAADWVETSQCNIYWIASGQEVGIVHEVHNRVAEKSGEENVPTLFVVVKELPKGALVEKQVLYHTGRCQVTDEEGESFGQLSKPTFTNECTHAESSASRTISSCFRASNESCSLFCYRGKDPQFLSTVQAKMSELIAHSLSVRVFHVPPQSSLVGAGAAHPNSQPITYIPCRSISTHGDKWDCAICVI